MGTATGMKTEAFPATFQWKLLPGAALPQQRTQATKSLQEGVRSPGQHRVLTSTPYLYASSMTTI